VLVARGKRGLQPLATAPFQQQQHSHSGWAEIALAAPETVLLQNHLHEGSSAEEGWMFCSCRTEGRAMGSSS